MSKFSIALSVFLILTVIVATFFWSIRPRRVTVEAPLPVDFPHDSFSHDSFEGLLQAYVSADGRTNYARWHESSEARGKLDSYLAAVSLFSPHNSPARFPDRDDELAYWLYAYNAYVIKSVLDHWPLESVTDVKSPLEVVTGLGFFYQQRFSFGGKYMSLLAVETDEIRKAFKDPRIHFVLNCASDSCPVVRPDLPVGDELQALLASATVEFINTPENVLVNHAEKTVYLSTIFKWYKKDFIQHLRANGNPVDNGLFGYISLYASPELAVDIAKGLDYKIVFRDYDWGLNSAH